MAASFSGTAEAVPLLQDRALTWTLKAQGASDAATRANEAAEKVAVASRQRPSALKAGAVFKQLRTV